MIASARAPGHHFGSRQRTVCYDSFAITETRYAPGLRTPWHRHDRAAFCLVLRGSYLERFEGSFDRVDCRASTVLFRPATLEHADHIGAEGAECFIIEPTHEWLAAAGPDSRPFTGRVNTDGSGRCSFLLHQALDEFRRQDSMTRLAIEGLLLSAVAAMVRQKTTREKGGIPRWLTRAREELDAGQLERVSLAELARSAGVHPMHFAASFRKAYGCSVGEYLRARRVEAGRLALLNTEKPIGTIALECGFCSQSHFNRHFLRHTGMTPGEYRRQH